MKTFEIAKRTGKNGRRSFKAVLHEIYPDSCIDVVNEQGTLYNKNGITWIREYCENAIDSIKDMSIRAEFLDDDRTEICGHGETGIEDDMPIFENAEVIGHFTNGFIDTIEDENGVEHTVVIAKGYIDEMCYKNFVAKLESDIANGNAPYGSVEIYRTQGNDGLVYKYGYKDEGRIPQEFIYSGYALLGVMPADNQAKLIELNNKNKEGVCEMTESEIKALVEQTVNEMSKHDAEINACKQDCETRINEANAAKDTAISEKNEIEANSQKIQEALDALREEYAELDKKYNALWEERCALEKALGEAKAKERLGELSEAIAKFSDEQREYANAEIEAFKNDPVNSEINSVVNKILMGIGAKTVENAAQQEAERVAEQNSHIDTSEIDIFGDIAYAQNKTDEDTNIF